MQHEQDTQTMDDSHTARRRPRLSMVMVIGAALVATALAYHGMVLFGLDVAGMDPYLAYSLAGFLEISLIAVALMARDAARDGRPYGVLLTLTWVFSGASGVFAALHEIAAWNASTPYMTIFRLVPPLVAALLWHLALVGERHLVTGNSLDERRRERRMQAFIVAYERWRNAREDNTGSLASRWHVRRTHARQLAARDRALKLMDVAAFDARMQAWVRKLESVNRNGERLDALVAPAALRGGVLPADADEEAEELAVEAPQAVEPVKAIETPAPAPTAPQRAVAARADSPERPVTVPVAKVPSREKSTSANADEVLSLRAKGATLPEIATRLGVSESTIKRRLREHRAEAHERELVPA